MRCNKNTITLRQTFDRDNTKYRYRRVQKKQQGGSYSSAVFKDAKFVNIPFTVRSPSKEEFYAYYKFLKGVFQPDRYSNYGDNLLSDTVKGNRGQFVPIEMCMPDGEILTARGKMIDFEREKFHEDGCGGDFNVQYLIGDKNCLDEGCWSGNTLVINGGGSLSYTVNHPQPFSLEFIAREKSMIYDLNQLTQGAVRPYGNFIDVSGLILNYEGAGCCKAQLIIRILQDLEGPITFYLVGADGQVQALKLNIPQMLAGDRIFMPDGNGNFVYQDGLGNNSDIFQYVEMKCAQFPYLCPTGCYDFTPFGAPGFNYFGFLDTRIPGAANIEFICTNKRC